MSKQRTDASDFNAGISAEFRTNGGQVGGPFAGTNLILVHHIGARSHIERVTPLAYSRQDDRHFVVAASNGGSPNHPDWYHNLIANPSVKVEVGNQEFTVLAKQLDDAARAQLWPKLVAESPTLGVYQARTARQIPVFMLIVQGLRSGHLR